MITMQDDLEYRLLGRESSNMMIHRDGEWGQGNYEEAGQSLWRAGILRLEMARLARQKADPKRAICDALSASSCFVRVGDLRLAEQGLARIAEEGPIPAERPDIADELTKRQREVRSLTRRQKRFTKTLREHPEWLTHPSVSARKWAQEQIEYFPAWSRLYALLAYLEYMQGDYATAARHANLAVEFDPEQPRIVCIALFVRARVESVESVVAWGRLQRARFSEDASVRIGLACLQAQHAQQWHEWRRALVDLGTLNDAALLPSDQQRVLMLALTVLLAGEVERAELHDQALAELGHARARLPKSRRAAPVVAALEDVIARFAGTKRHTNGRTNGTVTDSRKSLHQLEKALLLTCVAS